MFHLVHMGSTVVTMNFNNRHVKIVSLDSFLLYILGNLALLEIFMNVVFLANLSWFKNVKWIYLRIGFPFRFLYVGCFSFQIFFFQASMQQLLVVSLLLKLCWGHFVQRILPHLQPPWLYWLLLSHQLYQMFYWELNQPLRCLRMI